MNVDELRVVTLVKNNRLLSERMRYGYSQMKAARVAGMTPSAVTQYENFKRLPILFTKKRLSGNEKLEAFHNGEWEWRKDALRLAETLGTTVEHLWPKNLLVMSLSIETNKVEYEVAASDMLVLDSAQMYGLLPDSIHKKLEHEDLKRHLEDLLETLSPKEREVIEKRFGIMPGYENSTLESIAQDMGVTRERVRQVEAKAMRHLRHPQKLKILKTFLEDE